MLMYKVPLGGREGVWVRAGWIEQEYIMQHFCNLLTYRTLSFPPPSLSPEYTYIINIHTHVHFYGNFQTQKLRASLNKPSFNNYQHIPILFHLYSH